MKTVKLIFVSSDNNNKFYNMIDTQDGNFTVEYGRIGAKTQSQTYPIGQWDKKYKEKVNKGYKDNTEFFIVENSSLKISNGVLNRAHSVTEIVNKLQAWAKGSIAQNYTVTSEQVTQKHVDSAQELLNQMGDINDVDEFNKTLIKFFSVIPRKMKNVKDHLLKDINKKSDILTLEQDTLDVMAGQVSLQSNISQEETTEIDILTSSGLDIKEVIDSAIISKIKGMMAQHKDKFKKAYEVINNSTSKSFNNHIEKSANKTTDLFWHGSRNENWWSIMTKGLTVRPSNVVITGKMFGNGTYMANKYQKAYGYSSGKNSYWAKGNSNEAVLALYDVHVGNQMHIHRHDSSCCKLDHKIVSSKGFDSVYAHGGYDLVNDEFVIYQDCQSTIKYLVIVEA